MELRLVIPTEDHKQAAWEYRQEHFDNGEVHIHGSGSIHEAVDYESWLEKVTSDHISPQPSRVASSTYFAMADGRMVGTIQIRHALNDFLLQCGGHIGYGVRPSERRKGYAAQMLALALDECRALGIGRVLITCDKGNTGSARTIIKHGGVLENEVAEDSGNILQRYWITLNNARENGIFPVTAEDIPVYAEVIRRSFATVAKEFNLTRENAPTHSSLISDERLAGRLGDGYDPYGYFSAGRLVGFVALVDMGGGIFEISNLAVLPEYRHLGYGRELLDFCAARARELGGDKITVSIIEENAVLKNWYAANGFIHTGTRLFDHLPFTVGYMEQGISG